MLTGQLARPHDLWLTRELLNHPPRQSQVPLFQKLVAGTKLLTFFSSQRDGIWGDRGVEPGRVHSLPDSQLIPMVRLPQPPEKARL